MSIVDEQPDQSSTSEAPTAPPLAPGAEPTRRDVQRAVLHELVVLATECANREAELDREYQTSVEEGAKKQKWARAEKEQINRTYEGTTGDVQQKVNKAIWRADSVLEGTLNQLRAELRRGGG